MDDSVLVVGAGGLGAPGLLQLAHAGIRKFGIIDPDRLELSNLHRQILYTEADIGAPKAECAKNHLLRRFPGIEVHVSVEAFTKNHESMLDEFDLVIEGTDQMETKMLVSDLCIDTNTPYVFAGVVGTEGQVLAVRPNISACLRCLFDEAPPPGATPRCEDLGVIGPIAGLVAAEQVRRGLALLDHDETVLNKLWTYDGVRAREREIRLPKMSDCRGCGSRIALRGWITTKRSQTVDDEISRAKELSVENEVCPQTYVHTKRALDELLPGEMLWVMIGSDESARNVPVSAMAAGYHLLSKTFDGRVHRLLFQRPKINEDDNV